MEFNQDILLNMREAAELLGQTYRWMQRHYPDLIMSGVDVRRMPKDSEKGRLMFGRESVLLYSEQCRIKANKDKKNDR